MKYSPKFTTALTAVLLVCFCSSALSSTQMLQQFADGEHRSTKNKARNDSRHPVETLNWLGLKSDMTVVEVFPGGGWYTEILAPYLRDHGTYYAAGYDPESSIDYYKKNAAKFTEKLGSHPDIYNKTIVTVLAAPKKVEIAPEASADMVLTFRNTHSWMGNNTQESIFDAMFKALKPGGILGLVQHRQDESKKTSPKLGYITEADVISLAENAGFTLLARSEINANPADTKDYEKGVWSLPPVLRMKDKDREKYIKIGESDRMTLKFIKPE